jgi:hypothetical protein
LSAPFIAGVLHESKAPLHRQSAWKTRRNFHGAAAGSRPMSIGTTAFASPARQQRDVLAE